MIHASLNGASMTTREAAHAELARALHFPEYYGANIDALWDLVSTMEAELTLTNVTAMQSALGIYGSKILETLREADRENPTFTFRME